MTQSQYLPNDVAQRLEGRRMAPAPTALEQILPAHWEAWFDHKDPPGPINRWVWAGVRRRGVFHIKLTSMELRQWAGPHARDCGQCKNTKLHGDPRHGFCATIGKCVSLANKVLCGSFDR